MKEKVDKPYQKLVVRTQQLARLQGACEVLRKTARFLTASTRLRELNKSGGRELAKMAFTLNEIQVQSPLPKH